MALWSPTTKLTLPTNIRLGRKQVTVTNPLAYYNAKSLRAYHRVLWNHTIKLALPINIRLGWKQVAVKNPLAYYDS
jgi:hypothetical protein